MFQCLQAQDFPKSGIYSDTLSGLYAGILILSGIYSGILSGIYSGTLSSILSDILIHSVWHSIWHLFWHSILPFYLAFYSGILSGILSWHYIWHAIRNLFWHSLWYGHFRTSTASARSQWAVPRLRSSSGHWDLAPSIEVQQCPLTCGAVAARGWGAGGRGERGGRGGQDARLIKSRDPHLAGGEKKS